MIPRTPETGAGIVSFRRPGVDAVELVGRLQEGRDFRGASCRMESASSPHFYISPAEIDRFLAELP